MCVSTGSWGTWGKEENQWFLAYHLGLWQQKPCLVSWLLISSTIPIAVQIILYIINYVPVTFILHFFFPAGCTQIPEGAIKFFTKNPFHHHILSLTPSPHILLVFIPYVVTADLFYFSKFSIFSVFFFFLHTYTLSLATCRPYSEDGKLLFLLKVVLK